MLCDYENEQNVMLITVVLIKRCRKFASNFFSSTSPREKWEIARTPPHHIFHSDVTESL